MLPSLKNGSGRLEHVAVLNATAPLVERWPEFRPCAVLDVRDTPPGRVEVLGQRFEPAWSSAGIRLLIPAAP
jgi:hypothetical protein